MNPPAAQRSSAEGLACSATRARAAAWVFSASLLLAGTGCDTVRGLWTSATGGGKASAPSSGAASRAALPTKLAMLDRGQPLLAIPIRDLPRRVKPEQAVVRDPNEQSTIPFEGVRLEALLESVHGINWRRARGVRMLTVARQSVIVPVQRIATQRAWLVWKRADRPDFAVDRGRAGTPPQMLGPLYLVWDTSDAQTAESGSAFWVPQVTGLDLTDDAGDDEALQPAAAAPQEVQQGFEHYRKYCLRCHTINGRGGLSGPELNSPASVTEYLAPGWLERFIDAPDSVRARTAMPGLPPEVPNRGAAVASIVSYLKYMAAQRPVAVAPAQAPTAVTPTR